MSAPLPIGAAITSPSGLLDLESGPYSLERSALEERGVSWRKHVVEHELVEGAWTTQAAKELVVESLVVWVEADTEAALRAAKNALTDALDQLRFTVTITTDGLTETWDCQVAEYKVRTEQAFRFSRCCLVSAQVPRQPTVVLT